MQKNQGHSHMGLEFWGFQTGVPQITKQNARIEGQGYIAKLGRQFTGATFLSDEQLLPPCWAWSSGETKKYMHL